jgi:hypothetical protein
MYAMPIPQPKKATLVANTSTTADPIAQTHTQHTRQADPKPSQIANISAPDNISTELPKWVSASTQLSPNGKVL